MVAVAIAIVSAENEKGTIEESGAAKGSVIVNATETETETETVTVTTTTIDVVAAIDGGQADGTVRREHQSTPGRVPNLGKVFLLLLHLLLLFLPFQT